VRRSGRHSQTIKAQGIPTNVTTESLGGPAGPRHGEDWEANLYRLGVPEMVIQRILRHANASSTATYYIKTAADDVHKAMTTLGNRIAEARPIQSDTNRTPENDPPFQGSVGVK
jgi:hypothetical protein